MAISRYTCMSGASSFSDQDIHHYNRNICCHREIQCEEICKMGKYCQIFKAALLRDMSLYLQESMGLLYVQSFFTTIIPKS